MFTLERAGARHQLRVGGGGGRRGTLMVWFSFETELCFNVAINITSFPNDLAAQRQEQQCEKVLRHVVCEQQLKCVSGVINLPNADIQNNKRTREKVRANIILTRPPPINSCLE